MELSPCHWMAFKELLIPVECRRGRVKYPDIEECGKFFIFQARQGLWRDLLFYPKPSFYVIESENSMPKFDENHAWKGHYTNEELVRMPFFWKHVFSLEKYLKAFNNNNIGEKASSSSSFIAMKTEDSSFKEVGLNFGKWESKLARLNAMVMPILS